jgi:hypothetical protein
MFSPLKLPTQAAAGRYSPGEFRAALGGFFAICAVVTPFSLSLIFTCPQSQGIYNIKNL